MIFVYGDINVDALARLDAPLAPGADNLHAGFALQLGGVGANVAVALTRCGSSVRLAGCVGRDWLGDFAMAALARQNVGTQSISRAGKVTGLVVIPIEPGGQRTILGARGANDLPAAGTIEEWLDGVRAVHLVGYTLLSEQTANLPLQIARAARSKSIHVTFDPGPGPCQLAQARVLELLPLVDTLLVGLDEIETLTAQRGSEAMAKIEQCGCAEIILKRGEGGCQFFEAARWWALPPFRVHVVDTTGAGDAFAAGYIWAKLRGWGTADCALLANAMGAAAAARMGAGENMPGIADVRELLAGQAEIGDAARLGARLLRLLDLAGANP